MSTQIAEIGSEIRPMQSQPRAGHGMHINAHFLDFVHNGSALFLYYQGFFLYLAPAMHRGIRR